MSYCEDHLEQGARALYALECKHDRDMFRAGVGGDRWREPEPFDSRYIRDEFMERARVVLVAAGLAEIVSTVVTWKDGSETRYDYDASESMRRMDESPSSPAEWHIERRYVTPWLKEVLRDDAVRQRHSAQQHGRDLAEAPQLDAGDGDA